MRNSAIEFYREKKKKPKTTAATEYTSTHTDTHVRIHIKIAWKVIVKQNTERKIVCNSIQHIKIAHMLHSDGAFSSLFFSLIGYFFFFFWLCECLQIEFFRGLYKSTDVLDNSKHKIHSRHSHTLELTSIYCYTVCYVFVCACS